LNLYWLEYLGLHNKPKAEMHPGNKLTGPEVEEERYQFNGIRGMLSGGWAPLCQRKFYSSEGGSTFVWCIDTYLPGYKMSHHTTRLLFIGGKYFKNIYLLTPWSRVLLEKLTSKLCS
jgi:hypothetical protein